MSNLINASSPKHIQFGGQLPHSQSPRFQGVTTTNLTDSDNVQLTSPQKGHQSVRFGSRLSQFTELPPVPSSLQGKNPDEYSGSLPSGKGRFLHVRRAENGWEFVHRANAKGAIHNIVIVRDDDKEKTPYVVLIVSNASVFGGQPKIMLPAGLWGDKDPDETFTECARREVEEETGLENVSVYPLAGENLFVTSGGLTTERKGFTACLAEGTPNLERLDEGETIAGHYLVPLEVFAKKKLFKKWIEEVSKKGYLVESDIPLSRGITSKKELRRLAYTA